MTVEKLVTGKNSNILNCLLYSCFYTTEDLIKRLNEWKNNVENRGMRVNVNKTMKIWISGEHQNPVRKAAKWSCGVYGRGVDSNSIQCTTCQKWVKKKCSGIKGSMYKVMKSFICRGCSNPVISAGCSSVDIGTSANLEVVDKFCYLQILIPRWYVECGRRCWCGHGGQNPNWME